MYLIQYALDAVQRSEFTAEIQRPLQVAELAEPGISDISPPCFGCHEEGGFAQRFSVETLIRIAEAAKMPVRKFFRDD